MFRMYVDKYIRRIAIYTHTPGPQKYSIRYLLIWNFDTILRAYLWNSAYAGINSLVNSSTSPILMSPTGQRSEFL